MRLVCIAAIFSLLEIATCLGQGPTRVCVQDVTGRVIVGAEIMRDNTRVATTGNDGCAATPLSAGTVYSVRAAGFQAAGGTVSAGPLQITLSPTGTREQVLVTASRAPLAADATAAEVTSLPAAQLDAVPGFSLDDKLRQANGFKLYRRTPSWSANPTSQGVSLRGLGSTAASRTLVLSDEVPWNDPGGGWVRWNEIPELAIQDVEVLRGGASDLYGSSAMGGVIQIIPVTPNAASFDLDSYVGGLDTYSFNGLGTAQAGHWHGLAAASLFHTDGYIPVPEPYRGAIDADANDHSQAGRLELRYQAGGGATAFLRGNVLNDARQNGTVLQNNAARIWRYAGGSDFAPEGVGDLRLRLYGTDEHYRQSFTSVSADRNTETLTKLQRFPIQEAGGSGQWLRTYRHQLAIVAGVDVRDIRGNDKETPVSGGTEKPTVSTSARQRDTGVYGEILFTPPGWSVALSGRMDHFTTFDAQSTTGGTPGETVLPNISETVFDPRLGIVRFLGQHLSASGSVFRAFRGPTLNELYRTGQVGQELTLPNPNLRSERATGFELSATGFAGRAGSLRTSYFWTEVNRPITALLISQSGSSITEMRENLGQLRSRGIAVDYSATPYAWLRATAGYQFAKATVTQFAPQPSLVGLWIPQVPRNTFASTISLVSRRWGTLSVLENINGREYDDTANQYLLHGYTRLDVEYSRVVFRAWTGYISVQNLLDRSIEVARTPVLSLGTPQVVTIGLRRRSASE